MKTIVYEKEKPVIERIIKGHPTERLNLKRLKESSDFALKHDSIRKRVKQILKQDKYARKDDLFLLLLYYVKCNMIKIIVPLSNFYKIHKPESITREKRKLFEMAREGNKELRWLLDQETLNSREREEEKYREYFGRKHCL